MYVQRERWMEKRKENSELKYDRILMCLFDYFVSRASRI